MTGSLASSTCSQWANAHPRLRGDFSWLLTQLAVPHDLAYLRAGLGASQKIIHAHGDELSECLRVVPGRRLEPERLLLAIESALSNIELEQWSPSDERLAPIGRLSRDTPHPLRGRCLDVLHLWSIIFYSAEIDQGQLELAQKYDALRDEFSVYVVAAQSMLSPRTYLAYLDEWARKDCQPADPLFDDSRLNSRVASASRAVRRLSLIEHRDLLDALVQDDGDPLHFRIYLALQGEWPDEQKNLLLAVARLLEVVRPGWRRPDPPSAAGGAHSGRKAVGTRRRTLRDGFVRLSGADAMSFQDEFDDEMAVETILIHEEDSDWDFDEDEPDGAFLDGDEMLSAQKQRRKTQEEQELAADGTEWMPLDCLAGPASVESMLVGDPEDEAEFAVRVPGIKPASESRWVAEHIRRSHQQHALARGRLTFDDAQLLLAAMRSEPSDSPLAKSLVRLHTMLALGRGATELPGLQILDSDSDSLDKGEIAYRLDVRTWTVDAAPPAWGDLPPEEQERRVTTRLELADHTGFYDLLDHFRLNKAQRLPRLSKRERGQLSEWCKKVLPNSPPTLVSCGRFLIHRLLEESGGDLAVVRLVTGSATGHGGSVAHYAHMIDHDLKRHYQAAWARRKRGPTAPEISSSTFADQGDGYGARRVPTRAAVNKLFEVLWEQILTSKGARKRNLYTAYSFAGWVLGVALRPVTDPHFLSWGKVIRDRVAVSFVDKARSDYHRRVNGLAPALHEHVSRYWHFLQALDREKPPDEILHLTFRFQDPNTGRWSAFRPSHFKELVKGFFPYELYALRRYVRTQLVAQGIDPEDVDAHMGHWRDGVSPFDSRSTYPLKRLFDLQTGKAYAGPNVAQLMKEAGFKARWMPK